MPPFRVLISGAGVAGLSLAYWLARAGMSVTVVERATHLRTGGQAVDFRGEAHLQILHQMGIFEELRQRETRMAPLIFLGTKGVPTATLSEEFAGGDIEVLRGTLVEVLLNAVPPGVRYEFNDSITSLEEKTTHVAVEFKNLPPEIFDIVVGADGLRSTVRRLAFGEDGRRVRDHGYAIASFPVPSDPWREYVGQFLSRPGRCIGISGTVDGNALGATLFFASDNASSWALDLENRRQALCDLFADYGWIVSGLLPLLKQSESFYADAISTVELTDVWRGRIVLLGDAAHGGTVGGMGTGVALVGAFVLAQELVSHHGDYRTAYSKYQNQMDAYARKCRRGAAAVGPFFAPKTALAIWRRNTFLRILEFLPGKGLMERLASSRANDLDLSELFRRSESHSEAGNRVS